MLVALVLGEAARRPVGLGGVAAARAVQGRDVLQRDEDVPVQLDVGDLVDRAVRGQHAVLVVAAEERDLDLLALVLAGVVLHLRVILAAASRRPRRRIGTRRSWPGPSRGAVPRRSRSRRVRLEDARGAAVRDDEHRLARMARRQSSDRRNDAGGELVVGLAVLEAVRRPARASVRTPPGSARRPRRASVRTRRRRRSRAGPLRPRPRAEAPGHDLGGLASAAQRARVHARDAVRRRAASPSSRDWRRPSSFSGGSACPWKRFSRFQSVSPCRARIRVVTATTLPRPDGPRPPRQDLHRHRLDRRDRARDRSASGGRGRARRGDRSRRDAGGRGPPGGEGGARGRLRPRRAGRAGGPRRGDGGRARRPRLPRQQRRRRVPALVRGALGP